MRKKYILAGAAGTVLALGFAVGAALGLRAGNKQKINYDGVSYYSLPAGENTFEYDVVVVGGGPAGLYAATTVAETGSRVILLEKMPYLGGNIIQSTGVLNAVDSVRQEEQDIEDSVELFIKNTYESGGETGNLDLITILCENASNARTWVEERGGTWNENIYLAEGGVWPRSLGVDDVQKNFIRPMADSIVKYGGHIVRDIKAESLIMEGARCAGVRAVDTVSGKSYTFRGTKGVILATGGFGANRDMLEQYCDPYYLAIEPETVATGDGILMAMEAGAAVVDMEHVQLIPEAVDGAVYLTDQVGNAVYVNQSGKRFVSELLPGNELCRAILDQPGRQAYLIFDSNTITSDFTDQNGNNAETLKKMAADGVLGFGETLEDLAQSLSIDPQTLRQTVEEYNLIVDGESQDPFGREIFYKKLGDPPFYAAIRTVKIYHTTGGLKIDTDTHVIGQDGNPIPGLYACGEVTGGIHSANQISGNALADCIIFGRIAGQNVVNGI